MKIIFLETVQNLGGARMSNVELAKRLQKYHEVLIIDCYGSNKPYVNFVAEKGVNLKIAFPRETPFVISGSTSKVKNLFSLASYIPHWFELRKRVHAIIEEFQADYVILDNSKVLSLVSFYKSRKFKTVLFARGWFLPQQITKVDRYLYKRNVDKFLSVSEATKQAIYAGGLTHAKNIYVVHNGINDASLTKETAEIPDTEGCFKILHCGGFLASKGLHVSIEIAKILKERGFKFKLIITGILYKGEVSSNYYNEVLAMIKAYGLEDEVQIISNKHNVIPYFRACDVLIHPSSTEGLPRALVEAMALKRPVIANAVGGVLDIIVHKFTGFITNFNSVPEYVDYIEQLAGDKELYNYISGNAYDLITKAFNEESQIESFNNAFREN